MIHPVLTEKRNYSLEREEEEMKGEPDSSDLPIVKGFLTNWLPFLTRDLCGGCAAALVTRIQSLNPVINDQNPCQPDEEEIERGVVEPPNLGSVEVVSEVAGGFDGGFGTHSDGFEHIKATGWDTDPVSDRRAEKPNFGSVGVASEVAGGFDGYFRTYTDGLEHIKATGWDTDPESEGGPCGQEEEEIGRGVEDSKLGSMEAALEVPGGFDGYFRAYPCGLEHIKATGWDSDPECERDTDEEEIDHNVEESSLDLAEVPSNAADKATGWDADPVQELPKVHMSWADMVQLDQLEEEEDEKMRGNSLEIGIEGEKEEVSREQRDRIGFSRVGRKKDFVCLERIDGRILNILEGLELHTRVFSVLEQKQIVDFVYDLQEKGRNNGVGENTYSEELEPRTHMQFQFRCRYNYMEHNGIPPANIHGVVADPMPNLFKFMIKRLISWHVIPGSCLPDRCTVNIYEPGNFEPPNIDDHDFVRPFCKVSFLNEGCINFGSNLKDNDAGKFTGSTAIRLPVGSVLVFNGKATNAAKHCVPAVPSKRISITFGETEMSKGPPGYQPEPGLQNIRPYGSGSGAASHVQTNNEGNPFVGIRYRAKIRQDSKKIKRPTPNLRIERSRDCSALLRDHRVTREESGDFPRRFQHALKNDDRGKNCRGRSVRVEERRIIVTQNLDNVGGSLATRGGPRAAHPQIHIQIYNSSRRRVQLIL